MSETHLRKGMAAARIFLAAVVVMGSMILSCTEDKGVEPPPGDESRYLLISFYNDIVLLDLVENTRIWLTTDSIEIRDTRASWSSDGSKIVWQQVVSGWPTDTTYRVCVMDSSGRNQMRLAYGWISSANAVSEDDRIAISPLWGNSIEIYDFSGTMLDRIAVDIEYASRPQWLPGASTLLYISYDNELRAIGADGSGATVLGDSVTGFQSSPDGSLIAYHYGWRGSPLRVLNLTDLSMTRYDYGVDAPNGPDIPNDRYYTWSVEGRGYCLSTHIVIGCTRLLIHLRMSTS